ncbi:hypothetical protein [Maritimibacter fusiformis]|uniref:DUF4020 domain-containing protein n=1 Tax=Maritimibacter fusiformis TaxID=2603819 RepID=A0A5D0RQ23_9RHOB|nr:hypothetical protein [Maritimibacter fusiformis]TYB83106.1 hypothetical protein FVF75_02685 [Maritimibacter fusiformis]
MDLLQSTWPLLDEAGQEHLTRTILAGPPDKLLENVDEDERTRSRDRRVFDRITAIERLSNPPLTQGLANELARIRREYPEWEAPPGEQAHFVSWSETSFGPDTKYGADDLASLPEDELITVLETDDDRREGLLDAWRQFAAADSERAIKTLERIAAVKEPVRVDIWRYALWGLRDTAASGSLDRLLRLLLKAPETLFNQPDFSQAVAEILEATGGAIGTDNLAQSYWRLFDKALLAASVDPSNTAEEDCDDWVHFAINCSMGHLAKGFFAALFSRELKVGDGIPHDLVERLDHLMEPTLIAHRPARVIAASRLSYLYAVDPGWVKRVLLSGFDWSDETESFALWQGYGWNARIDPQLWAAIKPSFLDLFTPERLERFGSFRRNMAQLLMLVGIEFGIQELPRDRVRDAIRSMSAGMRSDAVAWIADYLKQSGEPVEGEDRIGAGPRSDALWRDRVGPWLKRVWPADPEICSGDLSEQFAVAATATDAEFSEAVKQISPYLVRSNAFLLLHELAASDHPDQHPKSTMVLIDRLMAPEFHWGGEPFREILERVVASEPALEEDVVYRRWDERLRLQGQ